MSTLRFCTESLGRKSSIFSGGRWQQAPASHDSRWASAITFAAHTSTGSSHRLQPHRTHITMHRPHQVRTSIAWITPSTYPITAPTSIATTTQPSIWRSHWFGTKSTPDRAGKSETKSASIAAAENDMFADTSKLGLFAKFKLMYKKYWYVMLPVHCITSCFWYGGFYYLSKSGVDVPAMLQYIHLSETIIEKVQHSDMGHLAVAYLCYKVATPLRYAVTLGGTTVSIKYLVQAGHIKPMPSKQQLLRMYEQKKANRAAAKADKETGEPDKSKQERDK